MESFRRTLGLGIGSVIVYHLLKHLLSRKSPRKDENEEDGDIQEGDKESSSSNIPEWRPTVDTGGRARNKDAGQQMQQDIGLNDPDFKTDNIIGDDVYEFADQSAIDRQSRECSRFDGFVESKERSRFQSSFLEENFDFRAILDFKEDVISSGFQSNNESFEKNDQERTESEQNSDNDASKDSFSFSDSIYDRFTMTSSGGECRRLSNRNTRPRGILTRSSTVMYDDDFLEFSDLFHSTPDDRDEQSSSSQVGPSRSEILFSNRSSLLKNDLPPSKSSSWHATLQRDSLRSRECISLDYGEGLCMPLLHRFLESEDTGSDVFTNIDRIQQELDEIRTEVDEVRSSVELLQCKSKPSVVSGHYKLCSTEETDAKSASISLPQQSLDASHSPLASNFSGEWDYETDIVVPIDCQSSTTFHPLADCIKCTSARACSQNDIDLTRTTVESNAPMSEEDRPCPVYDVNRHLCKKFLLNISTPSPV